MMATEHVSAATEIRFDAARLEKVFNDCFSVSCRTRLSGGAQEPLYQPATSKDGFHALHYREDYFASALHEVAHWCIAGEARRQQLDFGYWYAPEGRSIEQQKAFEAAEIKPQALEWYFSKACAFQFQVSVDNLELGKAGLEQTYEFKQALRKQALLWSETGLPSRAADFYLALCSEFCTGVSAARLCFTLEELR